MHKGVTVIIPSTCERARRTLLLRAIGSVRHQLADKHTRILVVANGPQVDEEVLETIRHIDGVDAIRLVEASVAAAQRWGREMVATPFFGFLDDDDEYLPDAISIRVAAFAADPQADVVVTNGYDRLGAADVLRIRYPDEVRKDPLRALIRENWLASCGGLFRSATIGPEYFDGKTRYFEWTSRAFRLALERRVIFVDHPTFRIYPTNGSASTSNAYREAEPLVLKEILDLNLPDDLRRAVEEKLGRAYHGLSGHHLSLGNWRAAVANHFASLRYPGGRRYLSFSAKVIVAGFGIGTRIREQGQRQRTTGVNGIDRGEAQ